VVTSLHILDLIFLHKSLTTNKIPIWLFFCTLLLWLCVYAVQKRRAFKALKENMKAIRSDKEFAELVDR